MKAYSSLLFLALIVLAIWLLLKVSRGSPFFRRIRRQKPFIPVPKWEPAIPVDLEKIIITFALYTSKSSPFVVFQHGTCVLLDRGTTNIEQQAKLALDKVYNYHPDFQPCKMVDKNWMIKFSQPVYSIVFQEEVERDWDEIENNYKKGICPSEVLLGPDLHPIVFTESWKVGLLGRARMFMDAKNPTIFKTWKPK